MNTKALMISALVLVLYPASLSAHADGAMSGMDMGGMKMSPKPTPQKPGTAPLTVTATVNPAAPQAGDNTLALTVLDAGGKPATGLKLTASVAMTSMDMGTTHPAFAETGGGHYAAKVNFSMDGPWRVVVRSGAAKVAVLDFEAGAKTPWKSPPIKAAGAAPTKPDTPATSPTPGMDMGGGETGDMAGMDMGGKSAKPTATPSGTSEAGAPAPAGTPASGASPNMAGMDMKTATPDAKMGEMTGIADMKTAVMPELKQTGTYIATGDEDWSKQAGFGHNAGMVGMMNQMMIGGSGMEGMKMPAMDMKFGAKNYAKPSADDADDMAGMDMGGGKAADKKAGSGGGMAGMSMDAAPKPGAALAAPAPVKITVTTASAPKSGDNALLISVTDAQGKPVTGATLTTTVAMTSMDMGMTHPSVTEKGSGQYAATVNFSMAGPWRVQVKVTAPGQKPQTKAFDFAAK